MELASALLHYKNNRSELIAKLKTIFADAGMNFSVLRKEEKKYMRTSAHLPFSARLIRA